ncbi:MAG: hypothetical protein PUD15_03910 [Prevotella sp.]|nr:hypothetical protein [Prevotella sp.]
MKFAFHRQDLRRMFAERLSQRVFYGLLGLAVIIFGLFYLVGYDRPFEDDYSFNDPLFTNAVLILMDVLLVAAIIVAAASGYRLWRQRSKANGTDNHIPVRKIRLWTWSSTGVCLLLTLLVGGSSPMRINGAWYTDTLWLKVSDMFILTSIILLLAAVGTVIYGSTRYIRRRKERRPC